MKVFGVWIGRPSADDLDRVWAAARGATVTYDDVGSTLRGAGRCAVRDVGRGPDDFARAAEGLRAWAPQLGIGARIHPANAVLAQDTTLIVVLPLGPLTMVAPDRIVMMVDEPNRFGFAYGTLPGHPERGEESFVIELQPDGVVRATICVEAEPATLLTRIGAPVTKRLQRRAVDGYLDALERFVEEHR